MDAQRLLIHTIGLSQEMWNNIVRFSHIKGEIVITGLCGGLLRWRKWKMCKLCVYVGQGVMKEMGERANLYGTNVNHSILEIVLDSYRIRMGLLARCNKQNACKVPYQGAAIAILSYRRTPINKLD